MTERTFGRLPSTDPRDRQYPLRAMIVAVAQPRSKHWPLFRVPLDQGNEGACVGFGWTHWLLAAPISIRNTNPAWSARAMYKAAQEVDEWPGSDYEGTSVRAGAKVLQAEGRIAEYRWAEDLQTTTDYIRSTGPVVIGVDWHEGMMDADVDGLIRVTGRRTGGHCVCLVGANEDQAMAYGINSWGPGWGRRGRFKIPYEDLEKLVLNGGEVCCGMELRP